LLGVAAVAGAEGQNLQPLGCLIEPHRVAEVGSAVIGVLETVAVERGDRVSKGQVIAVLRNDVERAQVGVAATKARIAAEVQAAQANYDLARQKLVRAQDLVARGFISQQALDQARAEADVAQQRLAQAREQRRIWSRELELAEAQLEMRTIRSPVNGVVAERYLSPGERVEERPIARVAAIDPLHVEVVLPAALFGSIRAGTWLSVAPELPGVPARQAKVVLVDRLIDGPSNTFRARLELPNAGYEVPAGVRCKVDLNAVGAQPSDGGEKRAPAFRLDRNLPQSKPGGAH
jgi:RND family efflux transporter MFP subunit